MVCCHKKDIYKETDLYMPIQVGKALSDISLNMLSDDTGDNISHKNNSYCELTGMYWAWKNLKDIDNIGFCHYRRYFDFMHNGRRFFPLTTFKDAQFEELDYNISKKAYYFLQKGGCIIAKPLHLHTSIYYQYCENHYGKDFRILGDVIRDTQEQKYYKAFWDILIKGNIFYHCNMFIMNWAQFDKYCNWLFPILNEVEKRIDITNYDKTQKRIYGYLSERLLGLYIHAEKINTMNIPIMKISNEPEIDNLSSYKLLFRNFIRDLGFGIIKLTI